MRIYNVFRSYSDRIQNVFRSYSERFQILVRQYFTAFLFRPGKTVEMELIKKGAVKGAFL